MSVIQLACLDMAGTTVEDAGVVEQAFVAAFDALEVPEERRAGMLVHVRATMGTAKIEVFRALFVDEARAIEANRAFESAYEAKIPDLRPISGAEEAIEELRARGVRVALTTGFSQRTRDLILEALDWGSIADLALSPSDAGRGRPYPDMVLAAVLRLRVDAVQAVAVAGDTVADVTAGLRAGASIVVGVRTGADGEARLVEAGATHVISSVAALPGVVESAEEGGSVGR